MAVLGPGDQLRRDRDRMLDALWPVSERQDASFEGPGIVLTATRTSAGARALGPPRVHQAGTTHAVVRFDWPTLAGEPPRPCIDPAIAPDPLGPTSLVWDQATQTLLVTRDAFGESPVWYASHAGQFAVSTCPAILQALPWISDQPDPLARHAMELRVPLAPSETGWHDLKRLPAGHRLSVREGQVELRRWWTPGAAPRDSAGSDREWFAEIRGALELAVARRIPANGAVGSHLSGGLDSTAVTLLASRSLAEAGRPLHTFSHLPAVRWKPPQPGDETPYVDAALACMPNAISHVAFGVRATVEASESRLLPHDAEVRDLAHREAIVTLLSGWGGDEGVSFNGDGHLAGLLLRGHLWSVVRWCHRFGGGSLGRTARVFYYKVVLQQLGWLAPTPGSRPRGHDLDRALRGFPAETRRILRQRSLAQYRQRQASSGRENQYRLLNSPHLGVRIDHDAEWSVPAGIGLRYPLLDPGLISLVLAAPERLFVLGGRTRTLMRQALHGLYPELIQKRHGKFGSHPRAPVVVDR